MARADLVWLRRWATDSPRNLAVFRIASFSAVLLSADVAEAPSWITAHAPSSPSLVANALWRTLNELGPAAPNALRAIAWVSAALALLGIAPRAAAAVCAVALFWLLGAAQAIGAVFHCHHLFLFAVLLAFSPTGDALTVFRRRAVPESSVAYGLPLRIAALLIASFFFFPGLWKLAAAGISWAAPDNLTPLLHLKWFEMQRIPGFRLDLHPHLQWAAGLATLGLELSLPALVVFRRTRPWAVPLLLSFHLGTAWMLGIAFTSLWPYYVALVDWERALPRVSQAEQRATSRDIVPAFAVGALLLAGQVIAGAAGTERSWPFACYPSFRDRAPSFVWALRVDQLTSTGWKPLDVPSTPRRIAVEREVMRRWNSGQRAGLRALLGLGRDGRYRLVWLQRRSAPEAGDGEARVMRTDEL